MAEIVLDAEVNGSGTNALVVGVSHYPYVDGPQQTASGQRFRLTSLTTAARSAAEVAQWLLSEYHNPEAPLASLHVLLSPSEGETIPADVQSRLGGTYRATSTAVRQDLLVFAERCRSSPENAAFVYFAGHGVQITNRGAIVLLEDFAGPGQARELDGSIDMANCHDALNAQGFARNQFWFVDACRQRPSIASKFEQLTAGVTLDVPITGAVTSSPLFLASSSLESAFAQPGGTTLFSTALLAGLRGAAAVGPEGADIPDWHVSVYSLSEQLNKGVRRLAAAGGADQRVDVTGRVTNAVVHRFEQPPGVRVRLELDPAAAADSCTASLLFGGREPVIDHVKEWPLERTVRPGLYTLQVDTEAPYQSITHEPHDLRPLDYRRTVQVQ